MVSASAVRSRADNWRVSLAGLWPDLESPLLAAESPEDVSKAFQAALPGNNEFPNYSEVIFRTLKAKNFPKKKKARINFLADSSAGLGIVSPRRSRDICAEERAADVLRHQIVQYEYWVRCSCGYKGISQNHGCKKCGAEIMFPILGSEMF
jgi:hypothetical protein